MNKQLKNLFGMIIIGVLIIGLYKYLNEKENSVKTINLNDYKTSFSNRQLEKLDGITSASVVPKKLIQNYKAHGFTKSQKKKALFVIGDPRDNSITFDMGTTAIKWFEENNMEVEVRDLYKMN